MGDVPTPEEASEAYQAALIVALARTGSRQRAEEFMQDTFERVLTTRPWSRAKSTYKFHVVGAVMSLINIEHRSARPRQTKEAHEGFHHEQVGHSAPSPEVWTVDRAGEEARQARADEDLAALEASVAGHPVASAVLRARRERGLSKAAEIAAEIGVPVDQVYRANEVLRDHLRALRKKRGPEPEE